LGTLPSGNFTSVNGKEAPKKNVVRFRDMNGRHRTVTVNAKNPDKYSLSILRKAVGNADGTCEAGVQFCRSSVWAHAACVVVIVYLLPWLVEPRMPLLLSRLSQVL
jgi:hypothetical protein